MYRAALCAMSLLLAAAGCGGGEDSGASETVGEIEETMELAGTIEESDSRDPNHSDLPYDSHTFRARAGDTVVMEVSTEEFSPLLKLVEVDTGAVLAEWEAEYPTGEALEYRIAASGEYEARVYATGGGGGAWRATVDVAR